MCRTWPRTTAAEVDTSIGQPVEIVFEGEKSGLKVFKHEKKTKGCSKDFDGVPNIS